MGEIPANCGTLSPHPCLHTCASCRERLGPTITIQVNMAAKCTYLSSLPVIPLVNIFSFLDREDLARCSQVCCRFNQVACGLPSWKTWCKEVWLVDENECPPGKNWKQLYSEWKASWGRYESCYASIKRAWNIIEEFTKLHCPSIHASLSEGLTEEEINKTESKKLNGMYSTAAWIITSLNVVFINPNILAYKNKV